MLKTLGLKVKRDFSGKRQTLENPDFLLSLITNHAENIRSRFSRWTKTERSVYKTYFNELFKGVPGLGNTFVDKTKDFEEKVLKSRVMMDEENMHKLTIELIDNGFIVLYSYYQPNIWRCLLSHWLLVSFNQQDV